MSNPYYNYTGFQSQPDLNDHGMGQRARGLGEMLTITDIRDSNNTVSFIAFVTSFTQNFVSNWNTQEALGRMDDIATFKNTTRQISVGWDVPAPDAYTAQENLNRCNALISMLYPTYTNADTANGGSYIMSKPPLVRLGYSNLISNTHEDKGLKGYITSLSWTPVLEMGSFHGAGGKIFPKVISLSIEFTALHEPIGKGGPTGYFEGDANSGLRGSSGYTAGMEGVFENEGPAGTKRGWPFGGMPASNNRPSTPLFPPEFGVDETDLAGDIPGESETDENLTPREKRQAKRAAAKAERQKTKDENREERQAKRLKKIQDKHPDPDYGGK